MAKNNQYYRAQQAHKRNLQKIADEKAKQKEKEFIQKYGKQILIGVLAAIVLIVAIWLGCKFFVGPGGSIPNWFGTLRNVEEDWLIANTGTTSKPKYFKLGDYTAPEGYTLDEAYGLYEGDLSQHQYYTANDENAVVQAVYVSGVGGIKAEQQVNNAMIFYPETSGAKQATIAGHDVHYVYLVSTNTQYDAEGNVIEIPEEEQKGSSVLAMYTNSVQDSCVLVMLDTAEVAKADIVTEETLLAEAEKFLPLLTVEK